MQKDDMIFVYGGKACENKNTSSEKNKKKYAKLLSSHLPDHTAGFGTLTLVFGQVVEASQGRSLRLSG